MPELIYNLNLLKDHTRIQYAFHVAATIQYLNVSNGKTTTAVNVNGIAGLFSDFCLPLQFFLCAFCADPDRS